jgi:alkanesulfonate monooxygenase SsuD/methylene tetrahydromethanopterin reductase-like flavin-dependent oxidoreductase (luciferase family)
MDRTDTAALQYWIVLGQRMSWPEMLTRVCETEALGFDGLFLVDHFYGLFDVDQPTHEAYTMLGALAPFTHRLRLGVLVCGNTYRNPAFLLKQAMTVDHISGGRVDFGVGAGWLEREHEAFGWDYPSAKERVDQFAEALEIWEMLQRQDRTTYEGVHYQLLDAPFEPKSLQPGGLPVLIGGSGPRMMRLIARHADIWNGIGTPEEAAALNRRIDEACAAEGRDPATLARSISPSLNLLESVEAFADGVAAYHAAGIQRIYLPWPRTEAELPILRAVARDVLPELRGGVPVATIPATANRKKLETGNEKLAAGAIGAIADPAAGRVLECLIEHPDERLDGRAIMGLTGFERHADVTRAFATVADAFGAHGIARPWSEAQRGWLMAADMAALLKRARG